MDKLKLDVKKIKALLKLMGRNQAWLADHIGLHRQYVTYDFQNGNLGRVKLYAKVFNVDAKELIKY